MRGVQLVSVLLSLGKSSEREAAYLISIALQYHKHMVISLKNYLCDPHHVWRVNFRPNNFSVELRIMMRKK